MAFSLTKYVCAHAWNLFMLKICLKMCTYLICNLFTLIATIRLTLTRHTDFWHELQFRDFFSICSHGATFAPAYAHCTHVRIQGKPQVKLLYINGTLTWDCSRILTEALCFPADPRYYQAHWQVVGVRSILYPDILPSNFYEVEKRKCIKMTRFFL